MRHVVAAVVVDHEQAPARPQDPLRLGQLVRGRAAE